LSTLFRIWKTSNLTLDFEIHQHLGSLKYVINIIMWIRDTGVTMTVSGKFTAEQEHVTVLSS
jgi:hypothetical protein